MPGETVNWYPQCRVCGHAAHGEGDCLACKVERSVCHGSRETATFCEECGYNVELHKRLRGAGGAVLETACPDLPPLLGFRSQAKLDQAVIARAAHLTGANARQVGSEDYKGGGYGAGDVIQHWDFAASQRFDYFQGQITKYVTRWKQKGGLKDLEKARHFLDKYIEVHEQFNAKEKP